MVNRRDEIVGQLFPMQKYLTVLFADLANSTQLYQAQGDIQAHQLISESLDLMKSVVELHGGILLRTVGDASLVSFEQCDDAFRAAIDIQREHQSTPLSLRVGFHYGEVIPDKGDVYGNAVNIAARVASFAKADEIYTTQDCLQRLSVALRSQAEFLDRIDFKGILKPLSVYRVHWAEGPAATAIVGSPNRTARYATSYFMELHIGAKRLRVDPINPVITFGRAVDNDIIVDHESASRNHASIEFSRGRYILRDSSTNGTYVVKAGRDADFVRREEVVLDQFGIIGLGWNPAPADADKISFRLLVAETPT